MRAIRAAWRTAQRSRRAPRDRHDECDRCVGLVFRHLQTRQLRQVYEVRPNRVFFAQFDAYGRVNKTFVRSYSSALAWLRNASAVHTNV